MGSNLVITLLSATATLATSSCIEPPETFTSDEWKLLKGLANLPAPPPDHSNKYIGDPRVIALGKKFYFDTGFSGEATHVDMLNRFTSHGRAEKGTPLNISCNTCHQVTAAGGDHSSVPRAISVGGGAYDVNGQQTLNAAYWDLLYWNGRSDSLWSQIMAVTESEVSMASDRLKVVWRIADAYRDEYNAAFPEWPLPALMDTVAQQKARLNADGTCILAEDNSCPTLCTKVSVGMNNWCLPRYPLRGRPGFEGQTGFVDEGTFRACQRGTVPPAGVPTEPFNDAFDCMTIADQRAITRIYVNWAKAIAAYEYTLVSQPAPFDDWVNADGKAALLSPAAQRGAKLFVGKASCVDCHNTPLFADNKFHNIGVGQTGGTIPMVSECPQGGWCDCIDDDTHQPMNCLPHGARDGLRKLQSGKLRRDSFYSDDLQCQNAYWAHADPSYNAAHPEQCDGRVRYYAETQTSRAGDYIAQWRTPSLRDVAKTGPYMHNGEYATLRAVVEHYNSGGVTSQGDVQGRKDARIAPLALSPEEISDLVAFLESLTGAPLPDETTTVPTLPPPSPF